MIYKGNSVSPGIAIGRALVYDPKILTASEQIVASSPMHELARYEDAVRKAQKSLLEIQASLPEGTIIRRKSLLPIWT